MMPKINHWITGFAVSGHDLADIFRRHYNQLVHATVPVCLAVSCKLYANGWISQTTKNTGTTAPSGLEAASAAIFQELEINLRTRMMDDPNPEGVILELCDCLETEPANLKTIIRSIRKEIGKMNEIFEFENVLSRSLKVKKKQKTVRCSYAEVLIFGVARACWKIASLMHMHAACMHVD